MSDRLQYFDSVMFVFIRSVPKIIVIMNPNETCTSHPSSAQLETVVEFMERNPGMAKGFLRTQDARERSRRQWEDVAMRLNSLGGTIKTYRQWIKYWSDKKSSIKKKIAARSAARRKTGGGVEDEVELSGIEERVVALCGGISFSTGDAHLGIEPFPKNDTPFSASYEAQQTQEHDNGSELSNYRLPAPAVSRTLFSCSSSSSVGTSQSILQNIQLQSSPVQSPPLNPHTYHPSLSPPPITLSHTPTTLSHTPASLTPSPTRRSSTQIASPVIRRETAASSFSRHATRIATPSRRPRTNMARASRNASSVSSRHTSSVVAPPPSQRRTEFSTITMRFLRVEEQQRLNAQILQSHLERSAERERMLAEAMAAVGQGLQALAEAMNRDSV